MSDKNYQILFIIGILCHSILGGIAWGTVLIPLAILGIVLGALTGLMLGALIGCEIEKKEHFALPAGLFLYLGILYTTTFPFWHNGF